MRLVRSGEQRPPAAWAGSDQTIDGDPTTTLGHARLHHRPVVDRGRLHHPLLDLLLSAGILIYLLLVLFIEAAEQMIMQEMVLYERQGRVFGFAQSLEQAA